MHLWLFSLSLDRVDMENIVLYRNTNDKIMNKRGISTAYYQLECSCCEWAQSHHRSTENSNAVPEYLGKSDHIWESLLEKGARINDNAIPSWKICKKKLWKYMDSLKKNITNK